jgi:hypothetical protein
MMTFGNGVNGIVFELLKFGVLVEEEEDGPVDSVEVCLNEVLGNGDFVKWL